MAAVTKMTDVQAFARELQLQKRNARAIASGTADSEKKPELANEFDFRADGSGSPDASTPLPVASRQVEDGGVCDMPGSRDSEQEAGIESPDGSGSPASERQYEDLFGEHVHAALLRAKKSSPDQDRRRKDKKDRTSHFRRKPEAGDVQETDGHKGSPGKSSSARAGSSAIRGPASSPPASTGPKPASASLPKAPGQGQSQAVPGATASVGSKRAQLLMITAGAVMRQGQAIAMSSSAGQLRSPVPNNTGTGQARSVAARAGLSSPTRTSPPNSMGAGRLAPPARPASHSTPPRHKQLAAALLSASAAGVGSHGSPARIQAATSTGPRPAVPASGHAAGDAPSKAKAAMPGLSTAVPSQDQVSRDRVDLDRAGAGRATQEAAGQSTAAQASNASNASIGQDGPNDQACPSRDDAHEGYAWDEVLQEAGAGARGNAELSAPISRDGASNDEDEDRSPVQDQEQGRDTHAHDDDENSSVDEDVHEHVDAHDQAGQAVAGHTDAGHNGGDDDNEVVEDEDEDEGHDEQEDEQDEEVEIVDDGDDADDDVSSVTTVEDSPSPPRTDGQARAKDAVGQALHFSSPASSSATSSSNGHSSSSDMDISPGRWGGEEPAAGSAAQASDGSDMDISPQRQQEGAGASSSAASHARNDEDDEDDDDVPVQSFGGGRVLADEVDICSRRVRGTRWANKDSPHGQGQGPKGYGAGMVASTSRPVARALQLGSPSLLGIQAPPIVHRVRQHSSGASDQQTSRKGRAGKRSRWGDAAGSAYLPSSSGQADTAYGSRQSSASAAARQLLHRATSTAGRPGAHIEDDEEEDDDDVIVMDEDGHGSEALYSSAASVGVEQAAPGLYEDADASAPASPAAGSVPSTSSSSGTPPGAVIASAAGTASSNAPTEDMLLSPAHVAGLASPTAPSSSSSAGSQRSRDSGLSATSAASAGSGTSSSSSVLCGLARPGSLTPSRVVHIKEPVMKAVYAAAEGRQPSPLQGQGQLVSPGTSSSSSSSGRTKSTLGTGTAGLSLSEASGKVGGGEVARGKRGGQDSSAESASTPAASSTGSGVKRARLDAEPGSGSSSHFTRTKLQSDDEGEDEQHQEEDMDRDEEVEEVRPGQDTAVLLSPSAPVLGGLGSLLGLSRASQAEGAVYPPVLQDGTGAGAGAGGSAAVTSGARDSSLPPATGCSILETLGKRERKPPQSMSWLGEHPTKENSRRLSEPTHAVRSGSQGKPAGQAHGQGQAGKRPANKKGKAGR